MSRLTKNSSDEIAKAIQPRLAKLAADVAATVAKVDSAVSRIEYAHTIIRETIAEVQAELALAAAQLGNMPRPPKGALHYR